jgi:hypothetical protein
MTKRKFITFSEGESYEALYESLEYSVLAFSKYSLKKYRASDFHIKWQPENWKAGYVFIYKILSCLKSLEEYDEVVWLDTDLIVTPNIDTIWNNKIENYPLLSNHRFDNFERWPHNKMEFNNPEILREAKNKIGLLHQDFDSVWRQANVMFFNRNCIPFLQEVLLYFHDYDESLSPLGDEVIINLLLWKHRYPNSLGNINLCNYYFSGSHIQKFINCKSSQEYSDLFNPEIKPEDEQNFVLYSGVSYHDHNRLRLKDINNTILVLHGNKNHEYNKNLIGYIINNIGVYNTIKKIFNRFPF